MKADYELRHIALERLWTGWPLWRQVSDLARSMSHTASSPSELVANHCFGRVAEHERLALEGFIAGERCRAQPTAAEPPDQDPANQVG